MRKFIYISLVLLSLSCESLGTNEFAEELSYYEYVGFGWTHFFDKHYIEVLLQLYQGLEKETDLNQIYIFSFLFFLIVEIIH